VYESGTLNFNPKTKQFYIFTSMDIPEPSMYVFAEAFTKNIFLSTNKVGVGIPCGVATVNREGKFCEINIPSLSVGLIGCESGQFLNADVTNGIISFTPYSKGRQLELIYKQRRGRSAAVLRRYAKEDALEHREVEAAMSLFYVQTSLEQCVKKKKDMSELRREYIKLKRESIEKLKAKIATV